MTLFKQKVFFLGKKKELQKGGLAHSPQLTGQAKCRMNFILTLFQP